jgi:beta-lactam-binding protein with PASTA domain
MKSRITQFLRDIFTTKKFSSYVFIGIGYLFLLFLVVVIADSYIIPWLVHDKDNVLIPDLTGQTLTDAGNTLAAKNLKIETAGEQYSDQYPSGTVLKQIPRSNSYVKSGRHIYVTLSKGKEQVFAPYLLGKTLRDARLELMKRGLEVGTVFYEYTDSIGADLIYKQNISSGRAVPYGSSIDLYVSRGTQKQLIMPQLIGRPFAEIDKILTDFGLVIGTINYKKSETFMQNTVIDQSPSAGETVEAKTVVNLILAK